MSKLRPAKLLFHLTGIALFTFACGTRTPSLWYPDQSGVDVLIDESLAESAPLPASPGLVANSPTFSTPEWVTDFSDPILAALAGQQPDFQDEFPLVCIYNSLRLDYCPPPDDMLNFQDDLSVLNQGWFYRIPGDSSGPFYSDLTDEVLHLRSPQNKDERELMVYNPYLIRDNFVLRFDFWFRKTQPNDVARFEISQAADQSVRLDLSKSKAWSLSSPWGAASGVFEYFPPERINVMILMRGGECAVYLNDVPLGYLGDCRLAPVARSVPWAVTFQMIAGDDGHTASAILDNVKLWDLDKIPSLE